MSKSPDLPVHHFEGVGTKKVRFNEIVSILEEQLDNAEDYHQSRINTQFRFQNDCQSRYAPLLKPILCEKHREKIFIERFNN